MKTPILYVILGAFILSGCTFSTQRMTIKGIYYQVKGCNGLVNGILIKTNCEDFHTYSGRMIEVSGIVAENKCSPEIPQCFSGQQMKNIESIKIIE